MNYFLDGGGGGEIGKKKDVFNLLAFNLLSILCILLPSLASDNFWFTIGLISVHFICFYSSCLACLVAGRNWRRRNIATFRY